MEIRISELAHGAIKRLLEENRETWGAFAAWPEGYDEVPPGQSPEEFATERTEPFWHWWARFCATWLIAGLEDPWWPYPVVGRPDLEARILGVFREKNTPELAELLGTVGGLLTEGLEEFRIRCPVPLGSREKATAPLQHVKTEPSQHAKTERRFGVSSVGILKLTAQHAPPEHGSDAAELTVLARTTRGAQKMLVTWVESVLRVCAAVCDKQTAVFGWFADQSPIGQPLLQSDQAWTEFTIPSADLVGLTVHSVSFGTDPRWQRFFDVVCLAFDPTLGKSGEGGLNHESVLKSGIWLLVEQTPAPIFRTALAGYLSVFEGCLSPLFRRKKREERAPDYCSDVLALEGEEKEQLGKLFYVRNSAIHRSDPRTNPAEAFAGWLLARAALDALSRKVTACELQGPESVGGRARSFSLRDEVVEALGSIGDDSFFRELVWEWVPGPLLDGDSSLRSE